MLFSMDSIRNHLLNHHSLSMQEYKNSCQAFTGEEEHHQHEVATEHEDVADMANLEPPQHQVGNSHLGTAFVVAYLLFFTSL